MRMRTLGVLCLRVREVRGSRPEKYHGGMVEESMERQGKRGVTVMHFRGQQRSKHERVQRMTDLRREGARYHQDWSKGIDHREGREGILKCG